MSTTNRSFTTHAKEECILCCVKGIIEYATAEIRQTINRKKTRKIQGANAERLPAFAFEVDTRTIENVLQKYRENQLRASKSRSGGDMEISDFAYFDAFPY